MAEGLQQDNNLMFQSKRLLALSLAVILGGGFYGVQSYSVSTTLVTMCYRGRTIQVPFYLRATYITNGATDGACPTTP